MQDCHFPIITVMHMNENPNMKEENKPPAGEGVLVYLAHYSLDESDVQQMTQFEDVALQLERTARNLHHLQPVAIADFLKQHSILQVSL